MKTILLILALLVFVPGCETTPNKFDQLFYNITTNAPTVTVHTITNWVSLTNTVTRTNELTLTNVVTGERTVTNFVFQSQTVSTNPVIVNVQFTNPPTYNYTANTNADKVKEVATGIGNLAAPGVGGPIAGLVASLFFSGYAWVRGNKQRDTSAALAQGVETGRALLRAVAPNGHAYDSAFTEWLANHQAELGVASQVGKLLADTVDPEKASGAADIITSAADALRAQLAKPATTA